MTNNSFWNLEQGLIFDVSVFGRLYSYLYLLIVMNRIAELCGVVVQSIIDRRFESLVVGIMRCTGFDLIRTRIYEFSSSPRNSLPYKYYISPHIKR